MSISKFRSLHLCVNKMCTVMARLGLIKVPESRSIGSGTMYDSGPQIRAAWYEQKLQLPIHYGMHWRRDTAQAFPRSSKDRHLLAVQACLPGYP